MSEPVSKKAQTKTLQTLPLELRLRIYEFVAARRTGPRLLLKEWFEKVDPNINTSTPAPGTLVQTFNANGGWVGDDGDGGGDDDGDDDGDGDGDDDEDEDEDDVYDDANDGAHDGADGDADNDLDDDDVDDDDLADDADGATNAANGFPLFARGNGSVPVATTTISIGRHTKYRHTLPIVKVNACPPPIDLLLVSHQIKTEAYSGTYNKMTLELDATKGFRHLEFFNTILNTLWTEANTPLNHIRNAAITFVWDTQWIQSHAHEFKTELCTQILRIRANLAYQLVCAIPNLTKVTIHWHDSENSNDAILMRNVALEPFDVTPLNKYKEPVDINIINHFEQQDTEHKPSSLISAMRQELDEILAGKDFC